MFNQKFFTTSNLVENAKKYLKISKGEIISISSAAELRQLKERQLHIQPQKLL